MMNGRPKIVKSRDFNKFKTMAEIKEQQNTPQGRINRLIESRIVTLEERVEEYKQSSAEDFGQFFERYAEAAYSTHYQLKALRHLKDLFADGSTDMEQYLKGAVERLTEELLEQPVTRRSTNPMANIAYGLMKEEDQKLRKFYQRLLEILEDE